MSRRVTHIRNDISEAIRYFEKSVLTRSTRHNIPEDGIVQMCASLKSKYYKLSYIVHEVLSLGQAFKYL
jgi:hypothetical protein